jgi:hypothetical protein
MMKGAIRLSAAERVPRVITDKSQGETKAIQKFGKDYSQVILCNDRG